MSATRQNLEKWYSRGKEQKSEYLIVVCDTFSYEDYPVFSSKENFKEKFRNHDGFNMQKIIGVFDLSADLDEQIEQKQVFNCPEGFKI